MADTEFDLRSPVDARAWFEVVGARGFAAIGALTGLALGLFIVLVLIPAPSAATPLAVADQPALSSARPTVSAETTNSPAFSTPTLTDTRPASSMVTATQRVDPETPPEPLETSSQAKTFVTPFVSAPVSSEPRSSSYRASEAAGAICGYPTASGPCQNHVKDSGYCYLHKSQVYLAPSSSGGGTVHVRGYYRKNGTYVSPHTRSAPRRR